MSYHSIIVTPIIMAIVSIALTGPLRRWQDGSSSSALSDLRWIIGTFFLYIVWSLFLLMSGSFVALPFWVWWFFYVMIPPPALMILFALWGSRAAKVGDSPEARQRQHRRSRQKRIVTRAILAMLGLWAAAEVIDPFAGSMLFRTLFLAPVAYDVTVDLTAEGQRVTFTRRVSCIPSVGWELIDQYQRMTPAFGSFGERLPSGGAVMVVTPRICGRIAETFEGSGELAIPEGHVPSIGWADDVDHPNVIETYVSRSYFDRPNARVRYHGMTVKSARFSIFRGRNEAFNWFNNGHRTSPAELGYGFYAWAVPEEEWSGDEMLAGYLDNLDRPDVLPAELDVRVQKINPFALGQGDRMLGHGLDDGPPPDGQQRRAIPELARIIPLIDVGEGFEIRPGEQGYLAFHRVQKYSGPDEGIRYLRILIDGEEITFEIRRVLGVYTASIYDPSSRVIYRIHQAGTTFPK